MYLVDNYLSFEDIYFKDNAKMLAQSGKTFLKSSKRKRNEISDIKETKHYVKM